jgi:small nuclear ribonucleoprotein (snRNP)-like protein
MPYSLTRRTQPSRQPHNLQVSVVKAHNSELNSLATVLSHYLKMLFFRFGIFPLHSFPVLLLNRLADRLCASSFFKTLVDHEVTVELKNDIQLRGTLKSVDQYLNIKLDDISVVEELKYPHLVSVRNGVTRD